MIGLHHQHHHHQHHRVGRARLLARSLTSSDWVVRPLLPHFLLLRCLCDAIAAVGDVTPRVADATRSAAIRRADAPLCRVSRGLEADAAAAAMMMAPLPSSLPFPSPSLMWVPPPVPTPEVFLSPRALFN